VKTQLMDSFLQRFFTDEIRSVRNYEINEIPTKKNSIYDTSMGHTYLNASIAKSVK